MDFFNTKFTACLTKKRQTVIIKKKTEIPKMNTDIVIHKIYSAFEGEFNPGLIKRGRRRHSDCFVYYLYGSAEYIFDGYTLSVCEGRAFYLPKNSMYDIKINEKSKYICVDFDFQPSDEERRGYVLDVVGVGVENLFLKLLRSRFWDEDADFAKAFSLLYEIYSELLGRRGGRYSRYTDFDKIYEYVIEHYTDPDISLPSISKETGLSESYIRRAFFAKMNVTPIKYINGLRVEKAKKMLTESNFSVSEIALATGFEDQFYFSRVFKRSVGVSPRGFRSEK